MQIQIQIQIQIQMQTNLRDAVQRAVGATNHGNNENMMLGLRKLLRLLSGTYDARAKARAWEGFGLWIGLRLGLN